MNYFKHVFFSPWRIVLDCYSFLFTRNIIRKFNFMNYFKLSNNLQVQTVIFNIVWSRDIRHLRYNCFVCNYAMFRIKRKIIPILLVMFHYQHKSNSVFDVPIKVTVAFCVINKRRFYLRRNWLWQIRGQGMATEISRSKFFSINPVSIVRLRDKKEK